MTICRVWSLYGHRKASAQARATHRMSSFSMSAFGKRRKKGGVFAILDIKKAFDTVPHAAILASLRARGIQEDFGRLVSDLFSSNSTLFDDYKG